MPETLPGLPEPKRTPVRRDPLFETLADVCGWRLEELTTDARGRLNRAAKQLRDVGADAQAVRARAAAYRRQYPNSPLTPQALTGNWASLAPAKPAAPRREAREIRSCTYPGCRGIIGIDCDGEHMGP